MAVVRTLLLTQGRADSRQADADHAAELAAANPADRRANELAVEAAAVAEAAQLAKLYAADEWTSHAMHLHGLMAMVNELYGDPVHGAGEATTAAATAPAGFRSRSDCIGRRP